MLANQLFQSGSGVAFYEAKIKPEVLRRIEWLGKMNDRVNICLANNDSLGLLELASQYAERGMMATANKIALLAEQKAEPR